MKRGYTKSITMGAMTASLYVVLTLISDALGLANGQFQIRVSEALTVLPILMPESIWGITAGCLIANIFSGCQLLDIVAGTGATLFGAILTFKFRKKPVLAMAMPVLTNTMVIPFVLRYGYGVGPFWLNLLMIFLSETFTVAVFGSFCYKIFSNLDIYR